MWIVIINLKQQHFLKKITVKLQKLAAAARQSRLHPCNLVHHESRPALSVSSFFLFSRTRQYVLIKTIIDSGCLKSMKILGSQYFLFIDILYVLNSIAFLINGYPYVFMLTGALMTVNGLQTIM